MRQYKNRIDGVIAVVILALTAILQSACKGTIPNGTPSITPDLPNWGSTPLYDDRKLPFSLRCVDVSPDLSLEGGVEWKGLRVGVSTYNQVLRALVEPHPSDVSIFWDTGYGNLSIINNAKPLSWGIAMLCFTDGRLSALDIIASTEFGLDTQDMVRNYGKPDLAVWVGGGRTFLWSEKGLALFMNPCSDRAGIAVLFSPVPRCELRHSWVYESLDGLGVPYGGGDVSCVNADVLDPEHIALGLGDCP